MKISTRSLLTAALGVGLFGATAFAQTATKIIQEGDVLGATTVDVIRFSGAANANNGFVLQLDTLDGASHIYGNTDGVSADAIVRTAGTVGNFVQTQFDGEIGLSDAGVVAYGATIAEVTGAPVGKAAYQNDTLLVKVGDAGANGATNFIDVRSTNSGTASFFGISPDTGLFIGAGLANSPQIGDTILGLAIDGFDEVSHGVNAAGAIQEVFIDTGSSADDSVVLINGAPVASGAGNIRENDLVPVADGGIGENWDNFDVMDINESGTFLITGDTNQTGGTADEFVSINGKIIAREGDAVPGGIIDGSIANADLNDQGLWAAAWDFDTDVTGGSADSEAIFVGDANGVTSRIVTVGDTVDLGGGSTGTLSDIGIALVIGDVQGDGTYNVWFQGRVDGGGTSEDIQFVINVVPEPASAALLGLGGLAMLRRRSA